VLLGKGHDMTRVSQPQRDIGREKGRGRERERERKRERERERERKRKREKGGFSVVSIETLY